MYTNYTDLHRLRDRLLSLSHQIGKTWIQTKLAEVWIDAHEREPDRVLAFSLCEPAEGVVEVAEPGVDDGDLIRGHPILVTLVQNVVQNRLRFFFFPRCRKHVCAFGMCRRRVAREASFLLESSHRFV